MKIKTLKKIKEISQMMLTKTIMYLPNYDLCEGCKLQMPSIMF